MATSATDYSYSLIATSFPEEYVLHAEINRPQALNAYNTEYHPGHAATYNRLMKQTAALFQQAHKDPNVRVVLLSARGKAFSAGLDYPETQNLISPKDQTDPARTAKLLQEHVKQAQSCTDYIAACTKPVICILHGISLGIAIDISSACDIRLATSDAKLSIKEVDIGLAADLGTLQRFPRIVGNDSWTRELALTGRVFSAREALERGFVSYVVENREEGVRRGVEIAKVIAEKSPVAVQGTKTLMNYSRDHSIREGLEYTQLWNSIYLQTTDIKEAIGSFFGKRKPQYSKL